jgi:hypothetical protein
VAASTAVTLLTEFDSFLRASHFVSSDGPKQSATVSFVFPGDFLDQARYISFSDSLLSKPFALLPMKRHEATISDRSTGKRASGKL